MKFNKGNIFFRNYTENVTERLVPDLLLFSYEVGASGLQLSFNLI